MSLTILDTSSKWNHAVFVLLGLVYFIYHDVLKDYLWCYTLQEFKAEYYIVCIHTIFSYLLIHDGHVGCFHVLALIHNASVNMQLFTSLQDSGFSYFRIIPRGVIAVSYGSCIFKFLRNSHTVFSRGYTN